MSDERLRVHEDARKELRMMRNDGENYSDVLRRVLPENDAPQYVIMDKGDKVVIPVDSDVHELANTLAGEGVSVGRVIDYYLLRRKVEQTIPADELLNEVFNRK